MKPCIWHNVTLHTKLNSSTGTCEENEANNSKENESLCRCTWIFLLPSLTRIERVAEQSRWFLSQSPQSYSHRLQSSLRIISSRSSWQHSSSPSDYWKFNPHFTSTQNSNRERGFANLNATCRNWKTTMSQQTNTKVKNWCEDADGGRTLLCHMLTHIRHHPEKYMMVQKNWNEFNREPTYSLCHEKV